MVLTHKVHQVSHSHPIKAIKNPTVYFSLYSIDDEASQQFLMRPDGLYTLYSLCIKGKKKKKSVSNFSQFPGINYFKKVYLTDANVRHEQSKLTAAPQTAGKQKGACAQLQIRRGTSRLNEPVADVLLQPQPQRL